jgi:hypothetical protein
VAEVSLDHGMTVVHVVVNEAMLMALRLPCLVPQTLPQQPPSRALQPAVRWLLCKPSQARASEDCATHTRARTHSHTHTHARARDDMLAPGQVEEIRAKKQEEWEKKRKAEDPVVRPEEPQDNSAVALASHHSAFPTPHARTSPCTCALLSTSLASDDLTHGAATS